MPDHDTEQIIDEFVEDSPRASEIAQLRAALGPRLAALRQERAELRESGADRTEIAAIDSRIRTMEQHLQTLAQEQAVSEFVERTIRATVARAGTDDEAG